ncbi:MAG: DALR anticodon-binding domain-containing protein, partial [Endomicrobia bacterium]|nr:DALR anticodon-binding domain-containing protein [Endomicrobiia bacterium]
LLEGYNIDEIKTVLFNFNGEFYTKWLIISAIKSYREKTEFAKFIELYKRIYNILQQGRKKMLLTETKGVVNKQLFQKIEEKRLYEKLLEVKQQIESLYKEKKFVEIINTILHLKPEIDMFFDTVLVFDNNTDIAKNRLRLLEELLEIFVNIGAFHLIQG